MLANLTLLFLFYLFSSSRASNNFPCSCDETTTISVKNRTCYYAIHKERFRFRGGCQCISGFAHPYLNKTSQLVSCRPTFDDDSPLSVRCFCDQSSAVKVENEECSASLLTNGTVVYESGCECTHLKARPALVQEFFLSRIYVVHCFLKNDAFGLTSLNENSFKVLRKRETNDTLTTAGESSWSTTLEVPSGTESTTVEDTTPTERTEPTTTLEPSTSMEPSTTVELTTELTTTMELSTTELTTEMPTTTEEELTSETTRKTSTPHPTSTTTRANTTFIPVTVTTTESNGEINFGTCNSTSFDRDDKRTAEILLYIASAWVIVWVIFTILINLWCRSWGHNRFLDFLQEVGLIVAFVFMGFFTLRPDLTGLCKATRLVLQFTLMYFLINAIMQSFFLNGLIKGKSTKNSCVPWIFNYTLPILLAGGLTAGFYFWMKSDYDGNEVHCFCEIYTDLFWTFVFPAWVFGFMAVFFNQTSITACKMSRSDVNLDQLFWAKKMCRGLPIFTTWFCMCFFMLLFGIDMQRLWIIGFYMGLCMLFGPIFFILHTFCYEKSAVKLHLKTGLSFYKPCPQKQSEVDESNKDTKVDLRAKHPLTDPIIPLQGTTEKADLPPLPVSGPTTLNPPMDSGLGIPGANPNEYGPLEYDPTSSQDLYNWLTDKNAGNFNEGENILFKKNV